MLPTLKSFLVSLATSMCLSAVTLSKIQTPSLLPSSSCFLTAVFDSACHSCKESHCRSSVTFALNKTCLRALQGESVAEKKEF